MRYAIYNVFRDDNSTTVPVQLNRWGTSRRPDDTG